jgi:hypothetical protein
MREMLFDNFLQYHCFMLLKLLHLLLDGGLEDGYLFLLLPPHKMRIIFG